MDRLPTLFRSISARNTEVKKERLPDKDKVRKLSYVLSQSIFDVPSPDRPFPVVIADLVEALQETTDIEITSAVDQLQKKGTSPLFYIDSYYYNESSWNPNDKPLWGEFDKNLKDELLSNSGKILEQNSDINYDFLSSFKKVHLDAGPGKHSSYWLGLLRDITQGKKLSRAQILATIAFFEVINWKSPIFITHATPDEGEYIENS